MPGPAAAQDHVSLDVTRAVSLAAYITGELQFRAKKTWPVLSGAAERLGSQVTPLGQSRGGPVLRQYSVAC
jgi:hypothetical protein